MIFKLTNQDELLLHLVNKTNIIVGSLKGSLKGKDDRLNSIHAAGSCFCTRLKKLRFTLI